MQPPAPNHQESSLSRRDLFWAIGLGFGALALYLSTPIERIFGDGSMLITLFAARDFGNAVYVHALYLPLARGLQYLTLALGFTLSPGEVLTLLSQISGGLGITMAYLVARGLGVQRIAALGATLLLTISPPVWFFSDTAEVHAPHLAMVGFVSVVTLFGPWRRPVLATLIMTACLPLLFLSHQSSLLLYPGWVLLAQIGRKRVAAPLSPWALFGGVLPAVFAALIFAIALAAKMRGLGLLESLQTSSSLVSAYIKSPILTGLWQGWLRPLGLLWLPLLIGLRQLRRNQWDTLNSLTLAALILPSLAFFVSWGVPERGAYSLGTAVFFTALAAHGLDSFLKSKRGSRTWKLSVGAVAALVLLQAIGARREVRAFDRPEINDEARLRIWAAEKVFEGQSSPFILVSLDVSAQTVTAELPQIYEVTLRALLIRALEERSSPEEFSWRAIELLTAVVSQQTATVVFDRSFHAHLDEYAQCIPFVNALETSIKAEFKVTELSGPSGGFWRIESPPTDELLAP